MSAYPDKNGFRARTRELARRLRPGVGRRRLFSRVLREIAFSPGPPARRYFLQGRKFQFLFSDRHLHPTERCANANHVDRESLPPVNHEPSFAFQFDARTPHLESQRADYAHPRAARGHSAGYFGRRRSLELPRRAIWPLLLHPEGRAGPDPLRLLSRSDAWNQMQTGRRFAHYRARLA